MQAQRVEFVKRIGVKNTLDFEVASENHNFYAEGVVVSNSHSVGYSVLTAMTCFLKTNYPQDFFLNLLKTIKQKHDKTAEEDFTQTQIELNEFGIKLLAPDLLKSNLEFSIEGKDIRYGLKYIKGMGEKTIEKLSQFKHEFSTKFQIFEAAEEAGLNLGALCALLQAGALDGHAQSRSRAVLEAQLWSLLTAKEKKWATNLGPQYNYDLLQIIKDLNDSKRVDENNKVIIKESRFETIKKHYAKYKEIFQINSKCERLANWHYERHTLGYSFSESLKSIYQEKSPSFVSLLEASKLPENSKVSVVAVVQEQASGKSRAKGTRYCKLTLTDESGSLNALMFNDKIDKCKENNSGKLPAEEDIVCLNGVRKGDAIFVDMLGIQQVQCFTKLSQLTAQKREKEKLTKPKEKNNILA